MNRCHPSDEDIIQTASTPDRGPRHRCRFRRPTSFVTPVGNNPRQSPAGPLKECIGPVLFLPCVSATWKNNKAAGPFCRNMAVRGVPRPWSICPAGDGEVPGPPTVRQPGRAPLLNPLFIDFRELSPKPCQARDPRQREVVKKVKRDARPCPRLGQRAPAVPDENDAVGAGRPGAINQASITYG